MQLVILYIFIGVWISVILMVICTLCLARHLYSGEEDTLFFELREAEIKDNVILKVSRRNRFMECIHRRVVN